MKSKTVKISSKLLAALLAIVLTVGVMPSVALAADEEESKVSSAEIIPANVEMYVGDSYRLTGRFIRDSLETSYNANWESSDTSVVTVEDVSTAQSRKVSTSFFKAITAVSVGTATITLTDTISGCSGQCTVNVVEDPNPKPKTDEDGTYLITSAGEFKWFANRVNGGSTDINAKLMKDIDLSSVCSAELGTWIPIGTYDLYGGSYKGTFDGQNNTISNLYVDYENDGGLFGYVCGGTLCNFELTGTVKSKTCGSVAVTLVGSDDKAGVIENCHADVDIIATNRAGGIAEGVDYGCQIKNCSYSGTITLDGGTEASGIVSALPSYGEACTITGCLFDGSITETVAGEKTVYAGGICGYAYICKTNIENCINIGTISLKSANSYVFGIAGVEEAWERLNISNVYSAGELNGTNAYGIAYVGPRESNAVYINVSNAYYLNTTASQDDVGSVAKAESELKSAEMITTLGESFKASEDGLNNGYPALTWQKVKENTEPVEPDCEAKIGDTEYATVSEALTAAKSGDTVVLEKDVSVSLINVLNGVTLDLAGHTFTSTYVFAVKSANVIDSVGDGVLKVSQDNIVLSETNSMIPAWNTVDGYIFDSASIVDNKSGMGMVTDAENDKLTFKFVTFFGDKLADTINGLLTDNGAEDNDLSIVVRLEWNTDNGTAYQSFVYNNEQVKTVIAADGKSAFTLTVNGYKGINNLKISAMILSDTGAQLAGTSFTVE